MRRSRNWNSDTKAAGSELAFAEIVETGDAHVRHTPRLENGLNAGTDLYLPRLSSRVLE